MKIKASKNSKLDLGTSKFESGASDLPPEGSKKRSCVEILDSHIISADLFELSCERDGATSNEQRATSN